MRRSVARRAAAPGAAARPDTTILNPEPTVEDMPSTSAGVLREAPRYNCRPRKPTCYVELEEPEFDEFVWCDECADFVYEYCSIHGPVIVLPDDKKPEDVRNAMKKRREKFRASHRKICAGLGVFTTLPMPKGVRFGPYKGVVAACSDDSPYSWQIHATSKTKAHIINAEDPRRSNWMRYVNCSRFWREQNLVPFQYQGKLYYRTIKNIPRGRELLVFYGREYARLLGIDMRLYNAPRSRHIGIYPAPGRSPVVVPPVSQQLHAGSSNQHETPATATLSRQEPTLNTASNSKMRAPILKHYTCNFYKPEYKDVSVLEQHIQEHAKICPFVCSKCYRCFATETRLYFHLKRHDMETFQCDNCNKVLASKAILIAHLQKHCLKKANTQSECENRLNKLKNKLGQSFVCTLCSKGFSQNSDLNKHMRTHSGEKLYKCTICSKACSQNSNLNKHMRIHSGEKLYKCTICSKGFTQNSNLNVHMRTHSGEKLYKCTICSKAFSLNSTLNNHMRIHSGEKPYKCTICSKAFSLNSTLNNHMRIHSGEKPYKCTICSKAFSQNSNLNDHMRTHSGEKPYKCTICSKGFSQNTSLNKHMRTHSGEKPYKCTICSKAFSENSTLNKHMRIHSGEKPYKCTICSKAFSQNSNLNVHMRTHSRV